MQVQHLIERCLLLHMNRDECIKALADHASVQPLVTLTAFYVERATKRESGILSSLFPWRGLSIVSRQIHNKTKACEKENLEVSTPTARNAKNQAHPQRRQQMRGHLSV
ncbi:hypothetical protein RHSIM_Rhsim12G0114300 [Rhododendron simsii]|uniref:Uncharacterized protein n=1 Tax=Rhododendron simsii TaxID=118357 RepID=A0A834G782_RHOSS|nr:hypothetical protein RHSIM_Rhsim12G0114300 [Rhododendron simsii]